MLINELLTSFLLEQAMVLVPVLMIIGAMLKKTPRMPHWLIPWALLLLGVAGGLVLLGKTPEAVIQGILAAGMAVFGHQLYKQTRIRNNGNSG